LKHVSISQYPANLRDIKRIEQSPTARSSSWALGKDKMKIDNVKIQNYFRSDKLRGIALYHTLGKLPVPEVTHRFV